MSENDSLPESLIRKVAPEVYNWRDEWISARHREFGWDAPMLDLDFPALEYDNGKPVALIEYKHINANVKLWHPSFKALRSLADCSQIPFFIVIYNPEHFNYYVVAMNDYARAVPWCDQPRWFHEQNYVKMLYFLRKKNCPADVLSKLQAVKLPAGAKQPSLDGAPL